MDERTLESLRALLRRVSRNGMTFTPDFSMDDWNRLQVAAHPCPELSPLQRDSLRRIEPVESGSLTYWPCKAVLNSGESQDCVYVVRASEWYPLWGVWPADDPGKQELSLATVSRFEESPSRLPAHFANALYREGESGMGYTLFEIEFTDGSRVAYGNGNAIDFLTYPPGKSGRDIAAVKAHAGRNAPHPFNPPDYRWCLFSGPAI